MVQALTDKHGSRMRLSEGVMSKTPEAAGVSQDAVAVDSCGTFLSVDFKL
jgi:hypothetical protein